jgi:hypothetical protein
MLTHNSYGARYTLAMDSADTEGEIEAARAEKERYEAKEAALEATKERQASAEEEKAEADSAVEKLLAE